MFLWAAGDFDRQGIRLSGPATERYHQKQRKQAPINGVYACAHCVLYVYLCMTSLCLHGYCEHEC